MEHLSYSSNRDNGLQKVFMTLVKILLISLVLILCCICYFNSGTFKPKHFVNDKNFTSVLEGQSLTLDLPFKVTSNQVEKVSELTQKDCGIIVNDQFITLGDTINLDSYSLEADRVLSDGTEVALLTHKSKSFDLIAIKDSASTYKIWAIHASNSEVKTSRGVTLLSLKDKAEDYYPELFNWKGYQEFEVSGAKIGFTFQSGILTEYWVSYSI